MPSEARREVIPLSTARARDKAKQFLRGNKDRNTRGLSEEMKVMAVDAVAKIYKEKISDPNEWLWEGGVVVFAEEGVKYVFEENNSALLRADTDYQKTMVEKYMGYFSRPIRAANGHRNLLNEKLGKTVDVVPLTRYAIRVHYGSYVPQNEKERRKCFNSKGGVGIAVLICEGSHSMSKQYILEQILRVHRSKKAAERDAKDAFERGVLSLEDFTMAMLELRRLPAPAPM